MRERLRDPEYAHGRRWYALIVLCLTLTIIGIDNSILNVALPTLRTDFGADVNTIEWVVTGYLLSLALCIPCPGWLGAP